jgi:hypothetical protein
MGRDWTERQRLAAAKTPSAWTTHPGVVTREDLFNEIDLLKARLTEKDGMLDSVIVARLTRIRSLAATLCPKPPVHVCDFDYGNGRVCGIAYRSASRLREHLLLVHETKET